VNVLEAARHAGNLKAVVSVTSDKCYENKEWHWGYRENEPLGGHDPYSNSKACAELVTSAYRDSFYYSDDTAFIGSARAGNVIGGGDWADDRLIPDILKAFEKETPVVIRNPMARRPWQHVLEPLSGYLMLAESLFTGGSEFAEAWNFGPKDEDCKPVGWILERMQEYWGEGASWELDKANNPHEAGFLKLDWSKAEARLNWQPKWRLEKALEHTINWHKQWVDGAKMVNSCLEEIKKYQK
ncbi:MAG: CDP-glucose 4,6-dehydratase, partial [Bacteroidia bacterium]|nr:CDP-glucose 4,6-dehydratase [Bacteroidia bacterium]